MSMAIGVTGVMLPELGFDEQLALCRELGVTHYTLRPRVISDAQRGQPYDNWGNHKFDLTPAKLAAEGAAMRDRFTAAGVMPFGTAPRACVTDSDDVLRLHFAGGAAVGAGRVRVMPPNYPKRAFDYQAALAQTIGGYERAAALARGAGVKIVIETHANSLATSPGLAWNIVRHFDPADIGIIFDLPNFAREGGINPVLAVSVLRPWIDHCHVGGSHRVEARRDERGFRVIQDQMCPLDESDLHTPTWLATLRDADVAVPLVIEDYTPGRSGGDRLRDSVAKLRRALDALPPKIG